MATPPAQLGDYLRGERIGEGGMGSVYRARHRRTGAEYALKLIRLEPDAEAILRFQREGEAQAALSGHPNIVRVHSAGAEQGWLYLVQELVDGEDLQGRLRHGPLPPEEARRLAIELGRGLSFAHRRGVLHRDLKPANVLIGSDGRPRLVDFGVARVLGSSSLTATGAIVGSPAWMSPEQANSEPTDERTDVYGLGAVLYHCLTGRPPAQGGTVLEVLRQVVAAEPPPPRSLAPDVPADLERVCLKAIAKQPRDRYPSPGALVAALESRGSAARSRAIPSIAVAGGLLSAAAIVSAIVLGARAGPDPDPTAAAPPRSSSTVRKPPAPPGPERRGLDDASLWSEARRGRPATMAALGAKLLDAGHISAAAMWLKRAGGETWLQHKLDVLERARRAQANGWDRRNELELAWTLLTPAGRMDPDPEHPDPDPTGVERAAALLDGLVRDKLHLRVAGPLRNSLRVARRPLNLERLETSSDFRRAAYLHPYLALALRAEAYRRAETPAEKHAIARGYVELCRYRRPREALRVAMETADDERCRRDLRLVCFHWVAWLSRYGDPDLRNARRALDYAERGAVAGSSTCAVHWLQIRSQGGLSRDEVLKLRKVFDQLPEISEYARYHRARLNLLKPRPRRKAAERDLQAAAPWLRDHASLVDLKQALRLWGEATAAPGLNQLLKRAKTREQVIRSMQTAGLLP